MSLLISQSTRSRELSKQVLAELEGSLELFRSKSLNLVQWDEIAERAITIHDAIETELRRQAFTLKLVRLEASE